MDIRTELAVRDRLRVIAVAVKYGPPIYEDLCEWYSLTTNELGCILHMAQEQQERDARLSAMKERCSEKG